MLSEKDLIFLGACLILNKNELSYKDETDMNHAIDSAKYMFNKVFGDNDMIFE